MFNQNVSPKEGDTIEMKAKFHKFTAQEMYLTLSIIYIFRMHAQYF